MPTSPKWFLHYHLFNLLVLVVGIACSKFLMSLGLMLGGLGFLLERDWKNYAQNLKSSVIFWLIFGFYLLHFIGMLWSENLEYGWNDIRVKSSLLTISLIVLSRPISERNFKIISWVFVSAVVITSIINFCAYQFYYEELHIKDIREMSRFGSHIRFGMMVAFSPFLLAFTLDLKNKRWLFAFVLVTSWLMFYTIYSQVLSGVISLLSAVFILLVVYFLKSQRYFALTLSLLTFCVSFFLLIWYLSLPVVYNIPNELPHNELNQAWNQVSSFDYNGKDRKEQELKNTLHRYLASKNLSIKATGIKQLNSDDIKNIEQGFADYREVGIGLMPRLFGLRYQIHATKNPNGHSLLERLEFWNTAWQIIKEQPFLGVGTGDVRISFEKKYLENNSLLEEDNRWRAHNTYLTTWLTFGVFGLLYFLSMLWYFGREQLYQNQWIGLVFLAIFVSTFFLEDTLETQTGVTFFSFFFGIFRNKIFTTYQS